MFGPTVGSRAPLSHAMRADLVNSDLAHGDSMPVCLTGLFISYARGCAPDQRSRLRAEHCGRRVGVPANDGVGIIDAGCRTQPIDAADTQLEVSRPARSLLRQLYARSQAELRIHMRQMRLHRAMRHEEPCGDVFVAQPLTHQPNHIEFGRRQRSPTARGSLALTPAALSIGDHLLGR